MNNARHALYLTDEKLSLFEARAGGGVRIDHPFLRDVRDAHDLSWLWENRIPIGWGPSAGTRRKC